ncbi:MAG: hypothetical protein ABH875_02235, partial [Candidatus Omnitrophota bacterium]
ASTIVHENVEEGMRGRIFSSLGVVMNLGLLIFMFAASSLAEIVGKIWILLVSALVFMGFGSIGLILGKMRRG